MPSTRQNGRAHVVVLGSGFAGLESAFTLRAKQLVEAHGGRIHAESRREGGARFVFTLPRGAIA